MRWVYAVFALGIFVFLIGAFFMVAGESFLGENYAGIATVVGFKETAYCWESWA
jgi:NADH:ubiquinone oxidoreductase subunit 6 (subunit J)